MSYIKIQYWAEAKDGKDAEAMPATYQSGSRLVEDAQIFLNRIERIQSGLMDKEIMDATKGGEIPF